MPFELDTAWELDACVALRSESFGALAYNYANRRLSFLKSERLADVVRRLGDFPTARQACIAAGVDAGEIGAYSVALGRLADGGIIIPRTAP